MCNLCGSSGGNTTTSQTTSSVLPWVSAAGQDIYNRGNTLSQQPYTQYGQQRLAGLTPDTQAAFGVTRANVGSYQPYMNLAGQGAASSLGSFNPTPYMNPYWTQVVDRTAQNAVRQDDIARAARNANAVSAGAFGGSRQALQEAEANRNLQSNISDIYLRGGAEAYDRGTSAFFQDADRMRQGASTLGQLGTLQQQLGASDAAALNSIGVQQQQQGQQSLDLAYQDFQNQRDYPYQQLSRLAQLFGGTQGQAGQGGTTTTTTQPAGSTLGQIGSAALGTYGLYKMLFGGGQKGGGPVRRRYAGGGRIALGSAPFKLRGFQEGGTVDTFPEGPWTGNLTPAEYNAIRSGDIAAYRRMRQLRGAAVGPSQVTTPPNTLAANPNAAGQGSTLGVLPPLPPSVRSFLQRAYNPPAPEMDSSALGEGVAPVEGFRPPADQPSTNPLRIEIRPRPSTLGNVRGDYTDQDENSTFTTEVPQRPQPVTAIRRPGQRSSGAGTLPTTVQEAASQDLPRPAFLPDMAQPGIPEASAATRTLNDAMRDNVDRGESILMTAAKWAQAASQPGATFMGSLGAGAEAGLTNLRQQRQAARDAERFSQQLDLQRQTLGETTRYHDIEAQRQAEDRASRERIAESSNRTHLDAARISAGAAGAGTSITINAIRDATRTLADPNASEQDRNAAREFLTAYRGSAVASEGRLDVAAENAISTRLRAEFPAGREMDPEAYDRRRAEISAEIRAQTGRTDRTGGNTAPQAAPPPAQRQPNTVYSTPRGPMRWTGTGWVAP